MTANAHPKQLYLPFAVLSSPFILRTAVEVVASADKLPRRPREGELSRSNQTSSSNTRRKLLLTLWKTHIFLNI
jgi:hypothetical protein